MTHLATLLPVAGLRPVGALGSAGASQPAAHLAAHVGAQVSGLSGAGCVGATGRVNTLCSAPASIHIPVDYLSFLPILIVGGGALLLLLISSLLPKRSRPGLYPLLTMLIGAASAIVTIPQWLHIDHHGGSLTVGGQILFDHFSVLFLLLISVAVVLGALFADSYLRREGLDGVESYVLLLLAAAGGMLMAESGGLIMLFLGLEIMSIAMYVLAAYHRRREQSGEAGLKYFILGAFSSAIFLYGIALTYGATGSLQYNEIAGYLASTTLIHDGVLLAGMFLVIVGLGFKVSAVPFHFWTPDVYQGSPTPFTGYMAAVAKAAAFAGFLRYLDQALPTQQANWRPAIWMIAVLTLLVGSVMAIAQRDLKRMLAYSSISQAGYVLIGVQAASARGSSGAEFYVFTYVFIIAGSFAVVAVLQGAGEARNDLGAIRGLGRRRPALALTFLVFLLAQAGVPLTSGFLGKFYVIEAAVERGQYPLAVIGMLAAAIAAFFYLRIALLMYLDDGAGAGTLAGDAAGGAGVAGRPAPSGAGAGAGASVGGSSMGGGAAGGSAVAAPAAVADRTFVAGLEPVPSLDAEPASVDLAVAEVLGATPAEGDPVSLPTAIGLGVCVAFTIVAGVTPWVIDYARHATALF